jgi:hypothetical protein
MIIVEQILNNVWLYGCGQHVRRKSHYFMQGDELLLFATGSNDDSLVRFFLSFNPSL